MKITAFDPEHPYRLGTGTTLGSSAGGDLSGSLPSPTVAAVQGTSVTSNLPTTVGDVLTISQVSPPEAIWATPSNATGSNFLTRTRGGQSTVVTHAASGAARQLDFGGGNVFVVTLTANCTFTFTGAPASGEASILLVLVQDATGNRTVTWPGSVVWASGTAPTLSTTANDVDFIVLESWDAGTTWYGFPVGGGGTPATSVTSETSFGVSTAVGTSTNYARQDHTHGTPANPVTGAVLAALGAVGELLITDTPAGSPLVFADLLQNEAGTDLIYADLGA